MKITRRNFTKLVVNGVVGTIISSTFFEKESLFIVKENNKNLDNLADDLLNTVIKYNKEHINQTFHFRIYCNPNGLGWLSSDIAKTSGRFVLSKYFSNWCRNEKERKETSYIFITPFCDLTGRKSSSPCPCGITISYLPMFAMHLHDVCLFCQECIYRPGNTIYLNPNLIAHWRSNDIYSHYEKGIALFSRR